MKKILSFSLLVIMLFICGCGTKDATSKMIDFTDYTVDEVIEWTIENDVAKMFSYEFTRTQEKPNNTVISQSLEAGEVISGNVIITAAMNNELLQSGDGSVMVPNIIGKSFDDAKAQLSQLGLTYDFVYQSSLYAKDTVILCDPLPGMMVSSDAKVILTLSAGQKNSKISIDLEINVDSDEDITIKAYVDGELDKSKTVILDSSIKHKVFSFTGTGKKQIKFKINNVEYAIYEVDFDTSEVHLLG